ncbi:MAG: PEP-CTERM sorting domain-containing protein [Bryobacteraceae bacterium]
MTSVAGWRVFGLGLLVLALLGGTHTANAGIIDIFSDTSGTYFSTFASGTGSGNDVAIPVSPAWATPTILGAEWVSYVPSAGGSTGCNVFVPTTGRCTPNAGNPPTYSNTSTPTATFYYTFTLPNAFNTGSISIWADDTAAVYLDPGTVTSGQGTTGALASIAANFNGGSVCANGPIGCIQADPGVLTFGDGAGQIDVGAGTYTLVIDAYQFVGGSPFGVLYDGAIDSETSPSVPEPVSYVLMGLGLAAIGILIPRRKRS